MAMTKMTTKEDTNTTIQKRMILFQPLVHQRLMGRAQPGYSFSCSIMSVTCGNITYVQISNFYAKFVITFVSMSKHVFWVLNRIVLLIHTYSSRNNNIKFYLCTLICRPGLEVIKLFSCSTQLSTKYPAHNIY